MPYHPETTVIRGLARIHRERRLPPQAVPISTHVVTNMPVDANYIVLQGNVLRDYQVIDVAERLKLRDSEQAAELIEVSEGSRVEIGQTLAQRGRGRRAKLLQSDVTGEVVRIDGSRIILQVSARAVEVPAKLQGEVESVGQRTVQVQGTGAVIQCAWGNGGFCYQAFTFVPPDGFVGLSKLDVRISEYRNMVLISPSPLTKGDLLVAQQQEVAGVVAPSMPSNLREFAMQLKFPVLLTEGFGQRRPTAMIYNLLQTNARRQAAFDAVVPEPWSWDRPEILIPLPHGNMTPSVPAVGQALSPGQQVRITRAPWDGLTGEVVEILPTPQVIANGLRLPTARVRLSDDRTGLVPLANLELLG